MSEASISDIRKKKDLSGVHVEWYLRYLEEGLEPGEGLRVDVIFNSGTKEEGSNEDQSTRGKCSHDG